MNGDVCIDVRNVTKEFRLKTAATPTFKSAVLERFRPGARRFEALKDVTFAVTRGETLGVIGANGAGKSTLLSIVGGIMSPTSGSVKVDGVIASLMELGAGFHPDLTGRENIFLYGATLGIPQREIKKRLESIIKFAEIQEFIDQPVKHYSSGMYVRLGFAVAVEVNPDVLLIDEVLAVGDASFRRKCVERMKQFKREKKTMLIISHDLGTLQLISDRIILLSNGRIIGDGAPDDMIGKYEALSFAGDSGAIRREWGTREVLLTGAKFFSRDGRESEVFKSGDPLRALVSYKAAKRVENPVFGFAVSDKDGRLVTGNNTQIEKMQIPRVENEGAITLHIEKLLLAPGKYFFSFSVHSADHTVNYHRLDNCFTLAVESDKRSEGCCYLPCRWEI